MCFGTDPLQEEETPIFVPPVPILHGWRAAPDTDPAVGPAPGQRQACLLLTAALAEWEVLSFRMSVPVKWPHAGSRRVVSLGQGAPRLRSAQLQGGSMGRRGQQRTLFRGCCAPAKAPPPSPALGEAWELQPGVSPAPPTGALSGAEPRAAAAQARRRGLLCGRPLTPA